MQLAALCLISVQLIDLPTNFNTEDQVGMGILTFGPFVILFIYMFFNRYTPMAERLLLISKWLRGRQLHGKNAKDEDESGVEMAGISQLYTPRASEADPSRTADEIDPDKTPSPPSQAIPQAPAPISSPATRLGYGSQRGSRRNLVNGAEGVVPASSDSAEGSASVPELSARPAPPPPRIGTSTSSRGSTRNLALGMAPPVSDASSASSAASADHIVPVVSASGYSSGSHRGSRRSLRDVQPVDEVAQPAETSDATSTSADEETEDAPQA